MLLSVAIQYDMNVIHSQDKEKRRDNAVVHWIVRKTQGYCVVLLTYHSQDGSYRL